MSSVLWCRWQAPARRHFLRFPAKSRCGGTHSEEKRIDANSAHFHHALTTLSPRFHLTKRPPGPAAGEAGGRIPSSPLHSTCSHAAQTSTQVLGLVSVLTNLSLHASATACALHLSPPARLTLPTGSRKRRLGAGFGPGRSVRCPRAARPLDSGCALPNRTLQSTRLD